MLPSSHRTFNICVQTTNILEFLMDTFNLFKNLNVCYAFIFSGHTGSALIWASVWVIYCKKLAVRVVGTLLAGVTIFFISFDRLHYTVDIVLAIIISFNIIFVYHLVAYVGVLEKNLEMEFVTNVEQSPNEIQMITRTAGTTNNFISQSRRESLALIASLVRVVQWIDAEHLECFTEERQRLLQVN